MATLSLDQGTLLLEGLDGVSPPGFIWDERVGAWRSEGFRYRDSILWMRRQKIPFTDQARRYDPNKLRLKPTAALRLFDHQRQAALAWRRSDRRGVVVLPTGAGKTVVALEAIRMTERPSLILAPTLDLLGQWHNRLTEAFDSKIGLVGQGVCDIEDVTVITYHSAYRRIGEIGARFGLLIFDEVHHLTAPEWAEIARLANAPFRLGLTATYDPRQADLMNELLGPLAYWKPIRELTGARLAPYEVIRLSVDLAPEARLAYEREETIYWSHWQGRSDIQSESRLEILLR